MQSNVSSQNGIVTLLGRAKCDTCACSPLPFEEGGLGPTEE